MSIESNQIADLRAKLRQRNNRIATLRRQLESSKQKTASTEFPGSVGERTSQSSLSPENLIWIFCTGRSGSTWLGTMMGEAENREMWNEPLVGALFGEFFFIRTAHRKGGGGFLGPPYRETWIKGIRSMILQGAAVRYPGIHGESHLIIKEPHGSIGAPLLMEALPESRMIFLVRDPRDIVASALDARRNGGWVFERMVREPRVAPERLRRAAQQVGMELRSWEQESMAMENSDSFVASQAKLVAQDIRAAREAYEAHSGYKSMLKYEDLLADTVGALKNLYEDLRLPINEGEIISVVEKFSWENIPSEKRGPGKFYRKASPGGWKEDLTGEQVRRVEELVPDILSEFYLHPKPS